MQNAADAFVQLLQIMNDLRQKCPWDKKQTLETLRPLTIEETYELADAITDANLPAIKEELGDLLLHIVFYAKIAEEQQAFSIEQVITDLCQKLIRRHPHIYGNVAVQNEEDVKRNWEKMKLAEGKKSALEGVPVSLPALVKAVRIQEKARKVGFDWEKPEQVWGKVQEEMQEFTDALQNGSPEEQTQEFGDVLFALVNYARFVNIDPELALEKTNKKFMRRFCKMEELAQQNGVNLHSLTLEQMDSLWNVVKRTENS